MRHIRLVAFQDQVTGEVGLGIKGHTSHPELLCDWTGAMIAHDIVEHQNGLDRIGDVGDEIEALGASWHIRGRHGLFDSKYHTPEYVMAAGLSQTACDLYDEGQHWFPRLGRYKTAEHYCDEDFEAILEEARPILTRDLHSEMDDPSNFPEEAFWDNALHLLRMGYRKSARRWGENFRGTNTFQAIRNACAPFAKDCTEGDEFRLSYGDGRAQCVQLAGDW